MGRVRVVRLDDQVEAPPKRYRYTGMERDEESGLSYHGARYYNTAVSRWVSCDPTLTNDGLNLYRYVHNNPLRFIDRLGRQSTTGAQSPEVVREKLKQEFMELLAYQILPAINSRMQVGGAGRELSLSMLISYHEAGGGLWGISNAANRINPLNLALEAGYMSKVSFESDRPLHGGLFAGMAVVQTANTIGFAVGGARFLSPLVPRAASLLPPLTSNRSMTLAIGKLQRELPGLKYDFRGWSTQLAEMHAGDLVEATQATRRGDLPGSATVGVDLLTGEVKASTSGTIGARLDPISGNPIVGTFEPPPVFPHPDMPLPPGATLLSDQGPQLRPLNTCGDPKVIDYFNFNNSAANSGQVEISNVRVRPTSSFPTGTPLERCKNCQITTAGAIVPTDP